MQAAGERACAADPRRLSATAGLVGCGDGRLRRPCRLGARPAGRVTRRTVVTRLLLDVPADTPVPAARGAVLAPSSSTAPSRYLLSLLSAIRLDAADALARLAPRRRHDAHAYFDAPLARRARRSKLAPWSLRPEPHPRDDLSDNQLIIIMGTMHGARASGLATVTSAARHPHASRERRSSARTDHRRLHSLSLVDSAGYLATYALPASAQRHHAVGAQTRPSRHRRPPAATQRHRSARSPGPVVRRVAPTQLCATIRCAASPGPVVRDGPARRHSSTRAGRW